jgi:hypothetical protein
MTEKVRKFIISLACLAIIAGCGYYIYDWVQKHKEKENPQPKTVGPIATTSGDPSRCKDVIRMVSLAMSQYALDNKDMFPAKLSLLYPSYASAPIIFVCPGRDVTMDKSKPLNEVRKKIDEYCSYKIVSGTNINSPQYWIVLFCNDKCHDGYIVVCLSGGGSKTLTKKEFDDYMHRQVAEMRRGK